MTTGARDRALSDRDYQALAQFRHALRVFLRFSDRAARQAGLTPSKHQLLLAVKGHPGSAPTLSVVSEMLQLERHSASELVDRTVRAGLLLRQADPEDHRRTLLHLTRTGEAKIAALSALHRDELRRFRTEMHEVLRELG